MEGVAVHIKICNTMNAVLYKLFSPILLSDGMSKRPVQQSFGKSRPSIQSIFEYAAYAVHILRYTHNLTYIT